MSLLFNEIHTHYFAKATKLLDDEIEEGSEGDLVRARVALEALRLLYNDVLDTLMFGDKGASLCAVIGGATPTIQYQSDKSFPFWIPGTGIKVVCLTPAIGRVETSVSHRRSH